MLFWYNLDFLNDQKKLREATENQRRTKTEEFILLAKNSQGKKSSCENGFILQKNFAS